MYKALVLICLSSLCLASDYPKVDDESPALHDLKSIYPNEITTGAAHAPVTLIAYINYDCPYCALLEKEVLPALRSTFESTGKLKIVYRIFPMSNDLTGHSFLTAELALCGAQSHRFPEISTTLFNDQGKDFWKHYEVWAEASGADASSTIKSCIAFHKTRHQVIASQQRYAYHDIRVTPTVFINGKKIEGAYPYDEYEKVITALLKK